jgi:competence CoiA-like predicted nuclease
MHFPSFLVSSSGLFDFDLTFLAEAGLFFILAIATSFLFLSPVSNQIKARAEFIRLNFKKSAFFLFAGDQNVSNLIFLALLEFDEMTRQATKLKNIADLNFEKEVTTSLRENINFMSMFERNLLVKSALLFSNLKENLNFFAEAFLTKSFT